jgi:methionyl-tRNA formyltransferase
MKYQYGILVSGNLGAIVLKNILNTTPVVFVFTDSKSEEIINFCKIKNIPFFVGNPRNGRSQNFLIENKCSVILSINYLFIIEEDVIKHPTKFAVNFHGSLLPKYRGRTPHVWSIINNEQKSGITAHLIDNGCDTGDVIEQIEIEISKTDTGASILNKFNEKYLPLVQNVIQKIENDTISFKPQDHSKATYFGKRTPEDGLIDWNWHKERIFNWVRALSNPYPGAFSFMNGTKIIIDQVSFSDIGFNDDFENGTILQTSPLSVKCPNGVIQIDTLREKHANFEIGQILNSLK